MNDTIPGLPRFLIVILMALAIGACATTPRGKLADLEEARIAAVNLTALLVEQGIINDRDKPKLKTCFLVVEAAIETARAQLKVGVDPEPYYQLALKYFNVAKDFLDTNKGNLDGCTA